MNSTRRDAATPSARCRSRRSEGGSAQCTSSNSRTRPVPEIPAAAAVRYSRTDSNTAKRCSALLGGVGPPGSRLGFRGDEGEVGSVELVRYIGLGELAEDLAEQPVRRAALVGYGGGPPGQQRELGRPPDELRAGSHAAYGTRLARLDGWPGASHL